MPNGSPGWDFVAHFMPLHLDTCATHSGYNHKPVFLLKATYFVGSVVQLSYLCVLKSQSHRDQWSIGLQLCPLWGGVAGVERNVIAQQANTWVLLDEALIHLTGINSIDQCKILWLGIGWYGKKDLFATTFSFISVYWRTLNIKRKHFWIFALKQAMGKD